MLEYEVIHKVNTVRERLGRDNYNQFYAREHGYSHASDQLLDFTFSKQATDASAANLARCLSVCRDHGMTMLVFKQNMIQIAGDSDPDRHSLAASVLWPTHWLEQHSAWLDSTRAYPPVLQQSAQGQSAEFVSYRRCFTTKEYQGVYDVETGRRLTNRRQTIERFWQLGFAALRGRPLSIARLRWTGSRAELQDLTGLADRYWARQNESEMAKKMVSAYRSINRYAAWPGAW